MADQLLDQGDTRPGGRRLTRDVGDLAAVFEVERTDRLDDARRFEVDVDYLSLDGLGLVEGLAFRLLADVVPGRLAEIAPRRGRAQQAEYRALIASAGFDLGQRVQIGRASCRERVCRYVEISVAAA